MDSKTPSLFTREDLVREYCQRKYVETVRLLDDEKDYSSVFLNCAELAHRLPHAKTLWLMWAQCAEKLNLMDAARRCFVVGLHLAPSHVQMLDQFRQFVLANGPHNGQAEELRFRQLLFDQDDFELRTHYLKNLLAKCEYKQAFQFMMHYFHHKYVARIDLSQLSKKDEKTIVLLNTQQMNEFKLVADEFSKAGRPQFAIQILQLAVRLAPLEAQFHYTLYELFNRQKQPLKAFKALLHYLHLTSSTSQDQYHICGELLLQSGKPWHALLAYYQEWSEGRDPALLKFIEQKIFNSSATMLSNPSANTSLSNPSAIMIPSLLDEPLPPLDPQVVATLRASSVSSRQNSS